MINLAAIDQTQHELVSHLHQTQTLLSGAVSKVSGRERQAEVWAMPDLGLPHSVRRIHGGFFTGMLAQWECDEPFVPVDATVNVCAVGLYRISGGPETKEEFYSHIRSARQTNADRASYVWNFDEGNHFITVAEVSDGCGLPHGRYLILHSSAAEFKSQRNGLYPTEGNWFFHRVEVFRNGLTSRYLRYLRGDVAERFIRQAHALVEFNRVRLHYFAEALLPGTEVEEVSYQPHYGMPDESTVAIGCQWLADGVPCLILTAPGVDLFWVQPEAVIHNTTSLGGDRNILMPHGLGTEARAPLRLEFGENHLKINEEPFKLDASLRDSHCIRIRGLAFPIEQTVTNILRLCPGKILSRLKPVFSYSKSNS